MKKAFTLIELLIVIAIIGILSTIVIYNLAGSKKQSAEAKASAAISLANSDALMCKNRGVTDMLPPAAGNVLDAAKCQDQKWPTLPTTGNWRYSPSNVQAANGIWSWKATNDDGRTITFTSSGTQTVIDGPIEAPIIVDTSVVCTPSPANMEMVQTFNAQLTCTEGATGNPISYEDVKWSAITMGNQSKPVPTDWCPLDNNSNGCSLALPPFPSQEDTTFANEWASYFRGISATVSHGTFNKTFTWRCVTAPGGITCGD